MSSTTTGAHLESTVEIEQVIEESPESLALCSSSARTALQRETLGAANLYTPVPTTLGVISDLNLNVTVPSRVSNGSLKTKASVKQSNGNRNHKSSIRPFFCCGSELSLVSLVDGMELKDNKPQAKHVNASRQNSTSSEDDLSNRSQLSGKLSDSSSPKVSSNQSVVRRKKQNLKKRFGSLRFRSRWNPRLRASQPPRSVSLRCDSLHHSIGPGCPGSYHLVGSPGSSRHSSRSRPLSSSHPVDVSSVNEFDRLYPIEDSHGILLRERASEINSGIEINASLSPRNFRFLEDASSLAEARRRCNCSYSSDSVVNSPESPTEDYSPLMNSLQQFQGPGSGSRLDNEMSPRIHTQIDFVHCLMPSLVNIMSCPFYWGEMDRYEAERLLDNKPEGTFLLRDSAQEDFLFSVSFRRYNRSLHARVEQWNHRFSFDAHDPAVFSAPTVCALMEHYKDSSLCMFFEPMLTRPLPRNFVFPLQHISRSVICDKLKYDQIRILPIPNGLKQFLRAYHYKQKVCVRHFDGSEVA